MAVAKFPEDLLKLKYDETKVFVIKDRGEVIGVDLIENGYPIDVNREQLNKYFMNKLVTFKNATYIVKGIESHAAMHVPHTKVGLLLQPWGLMHQLSEESIAQVRKNMEKGYPEVNLDFLKDKK